ncbi:CPBP family intramembrane glutamic endopeptidase [Okeania sp. SIO1I7]|uniref:CPBP family intramembrane glutamic endopeptidase n=1 Tax=Okeania sp. SIO1I7 TaxID=2607772 RepID=UPI0013FAA43F|nr:type II CAAX endopeptidase family protein [Okeania sp. SIO1I7]NET29043.1 CPBP family intramembrane metalloprotease [Okeania sp. SIO1I7]
MPNLLFGKIAKFPVPIRIGIFILTLLLSWIPLAAPIYFFGQDANLVSILAIALLYIEFIILVQFWGKKVYQQPHLLRHYGLEISRRNFQNFFQGLGIGLFSLFGFFILEGFLGWVIWQSPSAKLPQFILEGFLVSLGIGFAEELLFRGWLLDELERDYKPKVALWVSSIVYALLHFIKPVEEILRTWFQFPGLVLLGLIFVWAKRDEEGRRKEEEGRRKKWMETNFKDLVDRGVLNSKEKDKLIYYQQQLLGLPIGIHAGFVWGYYIINVGGLVKYSTVVGEWIVGINGNPLAGVMGWFFLGAIALFIQRK